MVIFHIFYRISNNITNDKPVMMITISYVVFDGYLPSWCIDCVNSLHLDIFENQIMNQNKYFMELVEDCLS